MATITIITIRVNFGQFVNSDDWNKQWITIEISIFPCRTAIVPRKCRISEFTVCHWGKIFYSKCKFDYLLLRYSVLCGGNNFFTLMSCAIIVNKICYAEQLVKRIAVTCSVKFNVCSFEIRNRLGGCFSEHEKLCCHGYSRYEVNMNARM